MQDITINNKDDAKHIWQSFCNIHQKSWESAPNKKIKGRNIWHLGISVIGDIRYYYSVLLNNENKVTSAKLEATHLKKNQ